LKEEIMEIKGFSDVVEAAYKTNFDVNEIAKIFNIKIPKAGTEEQELARAMSAKSVYMLWRLVNAVSVLSETRTKALEAILSKAISTKDIALAQKVYEESLNGTLLRDKALKSIVLLTE